MKAWDKLDSTPTVTWVLIILRVKYQKTHCATLCVQKDRPKCPLPCDGTSTVSSESIAIVGGADRYRLLMSHRSEMIEWGDEVDTAAVEGRCIKSGHGGLLT